MQLQELRFQEGPYMLTIATRAPANPAGPGLAITFSLAGQFFALNHEEIGVWVAKLQAYCAVPPVAKVVLPWGPHEHQRAVITAGDACKLAAMLRALPPSIHRGQISVSE